MVNIIEDYKQSIEFKLAISLGEVTYDLQNKTNLLHESQL